MLQPYSTVPSYITKDGSEIRELMHPGLHSNKNQNLAEATVPVGGKTLLNKHTHRHQQRNGVRCTPLLRCGQPTRSYPESLANYNGLMLA